DLDAHGSDDVRRIQGRRSDGDRGAAVLHGVPGQRRDPARDAARAGGDVMTETREDINAPKPVIPYAPPGTPTKHESFAFTRDQAPRRVSISKPFIYLLLCVYFLIVVYPMVWLFYTSLTPAQAILLHPFSLPNPRHL